ncbi:MAG TPA: hypothetical protein VI541_03175, partial [Actinomycetota bacterium]|nr:hypothetical protein [Actinomycetota bacterium]
MSKVLAIVMFAFNLPTHGAEAATQVAFVPNWRAAINDPLQASADPTDATLSSEDQSDPAEQLRGYECDKRGYEKLSSFGDEQAYFLTTATLTVDSRATYSTLEKQTVPSSAEVSGTSVATPYWFDAAHYGAYTCGWVKPFQGYFIMARGTYRYDQTSPAGYAMADVECATGFAPADDGRAGSDKDLSQFISAVYRQQPYDPDHPDLRYLNPSNLYGTEWKPDRFLVTGTDAVRDLLDMRINGDFHNKTWRPVYPDPANPACSGDIDHTYVLDENETDSGPDPTINPSIDESNTTTALHFRIADIREYTDWDNCGLIQVSIRRTSGPRLRSELEVGDFRPPDWDRCSEWRPAPYRQRIEVGDGPRTAESIHQWADGQSNQKISEITSCHPDVASGIPDTRPCASVPFPPIDQNGTAHTAADLIAGNPPLRSLSDHAPYWFWPTRTAVPARSGSSDDISRQVTWPFTGRLRHTVSATRVVALRTPREAPYSHIREEVLGSRNLAAVTDVIDPCEQLASLDGECGRYSMASWKDSRVTPTVSESSFDIEAMMFDSHPSCLRDQEVGRPVPVPEAVSGTSVAPDSGRCGSPGDTFTWAPPRLRDTSLFRTVAYRIEYTCKVIHGAGANPIPMDGSIIISDASIDAPPSTPPTPTLLPPTITVPLPDSLVPQIATLAGTVTPGSSVSIYDQGVLLKATPTISSGVWQVAHAFSAQGNHLVTATATSPDGAISVASDPVSFTVDTKAPTVTIDVEGGSVPSIQLTQQAPLRGTASDEGGLARVLLLVIDEAKNKHILPLDCSSSGQTLPGCVTGTSVTWQQIASDFLPSGKLSVRAIAIDRAGNLGQSESHDVTLIEDPTGSIQGQPRDLRAAILGDSIVLSWQGVADASGYRIYRGDTPGGESLVAKASPPMDPTERVVFVDDHPPAGQSYYYRVGACREATCDLDSDFHRISGEITLPFRVRPPVLK